jgi:hypothetical protein
VIRRRASPFPVGNAPLGQLIEIIVMKMQQGDIIGAAT